MANRKSVSVWCFLCAVLSGLLWMILGSTLPVSAQEATPTVESENDRYTYSNDHDPNGTGKFYLGREIAQVMSFHGAPWLERAEREEEERLTLLLKALKLKPGEVVADIGAGSGVITLMMAPMVKPNGKVVAVDIQQEMLDLLADKLNNLDLTNVDLVLGTEKSARIPADTVDVALMVDVYHEFSYPYEMLLELSKSMKVGGRIVLVEYRREDPLVPIKLVHKMSEAQVKKELLQPELGLKWKETIATLPRQHVIVFEKVRK
ncbi:methyltransferase domain-containing protein [bacterium]|nr:methyltransferase domain-containing protein [bacterium]